VCTCGHSEKEHAPCGKCLAEGCECEVFEKQKAQMKAALNELVDTP
jgi:hypothetical protein